MDSSRTLFFFSDSFWIVFGDIEKWNLDTSSTWTGYKRFLRKIYYSPQSNLVGRSRIKTFARFLFWNFSMYRISSYKTSGYYFFIRSSIIVWFSIKVTTLNSNFLMVYSSENILFLYLHFTWLYSSWNHQRILKKHLFWKYENWFSSEVTKPTFRKKTQI